MPEQQEAQAIPLNELTPDRAFELAASRMSVAEAGLAEMIHNAQRGVAQARGLGLAREVQGQMALLRDAGALYDLVSGALLLMAHARPVAASVETAQSN